MSLEITTRFFDLWVFTRTDLEPQYLLFYTSQRKADRFFAGGRFWQIPTDEVEDDEDVETACRRLLESLGLNRQRLWTAEYVYTIYNKRYKALCTIPVFAAQVDSDGKIPLTWEHSEYGWYTADECLQRIRFRGLKEGLAAVRESVTERDPPAPELRML